MLMLDHRRDIDQVAFLPVPALLVVDVIPAAVDDKDLLFGHMPVLAGAARRRYFLQVDPNSSSRGLDVWMRVPLESPLARPLPGLLFIANHVRNGLAELDLFGEQLEIPIVGIFHGPSPFRGFQARAKYRFNIGRRT